ANKEGGEDADPMKVVVQGTWVDDFKDGIYDINYRLDKGGPSEWIQVHYDDGTKIDLNWYDFDEVTLSATEVMEALKSRYVGVGDRVFPQRKASSSGRLGLTRQLCPRLWALREEAGEIGAERVIDFMTLSYTLVMWVLDVPAMPAGPGPSGSVGRLKATRRAVPRWSGGGTAPPGSVGPMRRYNYEYSRKHPRWTADGPTGVRASKAPKNGQEALDNSVQVKDTSPRRVGVDSEPGEFVILDEHGPGIYHGHVRKWDQLEQVQQNALIRAGYTDRRGNILRN
ncbi:hypothetical protein, partial [Rhodococcus wratislaviensis]